MTNFVRATISVPPNDVGAFGELRRTKVWDYVQLIESQFWRACGTTEAEKYRRQDLPRISVRCDYHAPAYLDDRLELRIWVSAITRSTYTHTFEAWRGTTCIARAWVVVCAMDRTTRKSLPLPEWLLACLRPYYTPLAQASTPS